MPNRLIYFPGGTAAGRYAAEYLEKAGIPVVHHPTPEATHLLLDVPSFQADGLLKGGRTIDSLLEMLPESITVIGGMLFHPSLESYHCIDLLKDTVYAAKNAAITAHCAMQVAANRLDRIYAGLPVLVIGWGRIGKCLAGLLRSAGAEVHILAHRPADQAMLEALGYQGLEAGALDRRLPDFRLIFNTAPEKVISETQAGLCRNCLKIDLASVPGIGGKDVVWARGLPGICAPESSGMLIAESVIRQIEEETQ